MPLKLRLKLTLSEEIDTSTLTPDRVHGLFFSLVGEELAEILHERYKNVKPFSLFCRELFKPQRVKTLNIEVNLLEDSLIPRVVSSFVLNRKKAYLNVDSKHIGVKANFKIPNKWLKPYSSLIRVEEIPPKVRLKFLSPTTFRRHKVDLPFPLPELLLKSLVKRWIIFSNIPIEVDLRSHYDQIEVEKYNLKTQKVEFSNGGKLTTFVGNLVYNLSKVEDKEALKWFYILLNFSNWSGVGRKTTMGLGKVYLAKA